jgi:ribose transport system ATP-binding protein
MARSSKAVDANVVLRLVDVVKAFPGVIALKGVSLEVVEGEVHALLGENGAGKSTLMAVAAGALAHDSGTVEIGGEPLTAASPSLAQSLGISVVYQHTSVLNDLTVAENLLYCVRPERRAAAANDDAWIEEQLTAVGALFDKRLRVGELSVAERQLVEIAKALASQPKVLVLDEPTESLTSTETERLFANIERITARGTAVVYISHRLPEVRRVADRITFLRDGEGRGTYPADGVSEGEVLSLIVGRSIGQAFPAKGQRTDRSAQLLSVESVSGRGLRGVDFSISAGEIVGLAGVEGNGQREFIRALAGLEPVHGEMTVGSRKVQMGDPIAVREAGTVYLPGDRHAEGLFLPLSVRENMAALVLHSLSRWGFISKSRESGLAADQIRALSVKTPSADTQVGSLSGGNQQKVLFARSLACAPSVMLADEPTRGVDVGARTELYRILRNVADQGAAVVVLSTDAVELQGLCDRVLVFSRGVVVGELVGDGVTEQAITGAAITADGGLAQSSASNARWATIRKFLSGDYAPAVILTALIVTLGVYTYSVNPFFLSSRSLGGSLYLMSALCFVSVGQLIVLLTGGIDLSVGPLTGLTVVILSFFWTDGQGAGEFFLGLGIAAATAVAVGFTNGLLVRRIGLTPVIATLSAFIGLQGLALLLRSTPAGYLRSGVTKTLTAKIGPVPYAFIAAVIVVLVAEWMVRRTRLGMELRAIGCNELAAHRLGAQINRSVMLAYILCALFTAVGGLLLAGQIGIGDPTVGANYTLQSISAVVLGGASILGGRGSFLGAFAGVVLIQEITSAAGFLGLGSAWQYWMPGLLILLAAGIYSRTRASAVLHSA